MKKVIQARIIVRPEAIVTFLACAKTMVVKSNAEQGCLIYKLYQEVGNPQSFIFYEEYENQDALSIHNSSLYLKTFLEQLTELAADKPQVNVF
ncbi:MAG: putative quinol monooxygenase [Bacteroidetes bacterium]|nr:putative quinol monooxygenase [Bacteroidota bacterium]